MTTSRHPDAKSLAEKVRPEQAAVLVVDYQNDFVASGGAFDKVGMFSDKLAYLHDRIIETIDAARRVGARVVFLRCEYNTPDNRYLSEVFLDQTRRNFKGLYHEVPVCVPDSWGSEFYGDAKPIEGDIVITKHRFGGFSGTNLDQILRTNAIRTLIYTGVVTHVCVESTVREAFFRDYYNIVLSDVVGGYNDLFHETSLKVIDWGFGEVIDLAALNEAWSRQPR
ncbi:MAG: cysteine hydrolase [Acidimicrobiia bacterium]